MIPLFVAPVAIDADVHVAVLGEAADDDGGGVGFGYCSIRDYDETVLSLLFQFLFLLQMTAVRDAAAAVVVVAVDPMMNNDDCYCRQQMSHYCC